MYPYMLSRTLERCKTVHERTMSILIDHRQSSCQSSCKNDENFRVHLVRLSSASENNSLIKARNRRGKLKETKLEK